MTIARKPTSICLLNKNQREWIFDVRTLNAHVVLWYDAIVGRSLGFTFARAIIRLSEILTLFSFCYFFFPFPHYATTASSQNRFVLSVCLPTSIVFSSAKQERECLTTNKGRHDGARWRERKRGIAIEMPADERLLKEMLFLLLVLARTLASFCVINLYIKWVVFHAACASSILQWCTSASASFLCAIFFESMQWIRSELYALFLQLIRWLICTMPATWRLQPACVRAHTIPHNSHTCHCRHILSLNEGSISYNCRIILSSTWICRMCISHNGFHVAHSWRRSGGAIVWWVREY